MQYSCKHDSFGTPFVSVDPPSRTSITPTTRAFPIVLNRGGVRLPSKQPIVHYERPSRDRYPTDQDTIIGAAGSSVGVSARRINKSPYRKMGSLRGQHA